ncbi:MAG TPA: MFS transporter [Methyloceanibacter sp.]|nr:MFS transporter [Methyloceanibacter sp.]
MARPLLSFLLLRASSGFWQMLFVTLLVACNWTTIMPLIEAVTVSRVRTAGLDYGSVRLWGSGSFILASFGAPRWSRVLGVVTIACGPLYRSLGSEAYAVMALLALIGAASAVLLMRRRWRGQRVVGPIQVQPQSAAGAGMTVPEI